MASQDEIVQSSGDVAEGAIAGDIDIDKSRVDKLHKNAIGLPGALYFCLAGSSPISAMLFHLPGGWVTFALIGAVIIFSLSYFDVKWSVYAMAPFLVLEVGVLIVLDLAITIHGGAAGHDFVHTFTTAGANPSPGGPFVIPTSVAPAAKITAAPGGILGIGVGMALCVWSWVGFEACAVYGGEPRKPRRAVPVAVLSCIP